MEQNSYDFLKNLNVLVVEDDVVSRMLIGEILKDFEVNIFYARNGKEGVEMVKIKETYDFILMDLKMPIMNGFEATELIRAFGYTKPIIAQTAFASIVDKNRVLSSGFDAFITKPINRLNLLEALSKFFK